MVLNNISTILRRSLDSKRPFSSDCRYVEEISIISTLLQHKVLFLNIILKQLELALLFSTDLGRPYAEELTILNSQIYF
jgi:hypothetical protein